MGESQKSAKRARIDALGDEIALAAAHIDAATHGLLASIRKFDECKGWAWQGARSCAHWLSWRVGIALGPAREKVRVARALGGLPRIDAAFAAGRLSYSKVRAMSRVARPENEDLLLIFATSATGAQLEKICRGFRAVARRERKARPAEDERFVRRRWLPSGMVRIEACLLPDEAELVYQALGEARRALVDECKEASTPKAAEDESSRPAERAGDESSRSAERAGDESSRPAERAGDESSRSAERAGDESSRLPERARDESLRPAERAGARAGSGANGATPVAARSANKDGGAPDAADGLVAVAESFLAHRFRGRAGGVRNQLFIHLREAHLEAEGTFQPVLHDGSHLCPDTFRRLACDAGVVLAKVDDAGTPMDVGRRTRTIPSSLRRALWLRDGGCRFPGCGQRSFVDGHHLEHWSQGGATSLANMLLLCRRHHRAVHEEGFSVRYEDTRIVFRDPHGREIPVAPQPPRLRGNAAANLAQRHARRGLAIDRRTNLPAYTGDPLDLQAAVSVLIRKSPPP